MVIDVRPVVPCGGGWYPSIARPSSELGVTVWRDLRLAAVCGTAPPRAVLPAGLRDLSNALPLTHLVTAVQDPWFGRGWNWIDLATLCGFALAAGLPAFKFFHWD